MKKQENSFEEQWKKQFLDREIDPNESVWDRVGTGLANQQVAKYKRRILYYKFVAAAAILFALLIGSFSLNNWYNSPGDNFVTLESNDVLNEASINNENIKEIESIKDSETGQIKGEKLNETESLEGNTNLATNTETLELFNEIEENFVQEQAVVQPVANYLYQESNSVQFLVSNQFYYSYVFPIEENIPGMKSNPYLIPTILSVDDFGEEEKIDNKVIWAGLSFSSGRFDPNISYSGIDASAAMSQSLNAPSSVISINSAGFDLQNNSNSLLTYKPEESSYEPEMSYSYGLNFGFQFSKRFVLLSGLSYLYNNSSATVNTYIEPANSNAKYANHAIVIEKASPGIDSYNSLNSDIQLKSAYEFVTVPLNIGYNIVDKRINWMLSAGVSADFLIKNTIYDSGDFFNSVEYSSGADSPYNSAYFNAIFGTLLNYTFSRHYLISLEPSYRLGVSDLTKDNAVFTSRPSSFLITAGISYIF